MSSQISTILEEEASPKCTAATTTDRPISSYDNLLTPILEVETNNITTNPNAITTKDDNKNTTTAINVIMNGSKLHPCPTLSAQYTNSTKTNNNSKENLNLKSTNNGDNRDLNSKCELVHTNNSMTSMRPTTHLTKFVTTSSTIPETIPNNHNHHNSSTTGSNSNNSKNNNVVFRPHHYYNQNQNISTIKPVISDAKSKFFGFNSSNHRQSNTNNNSNNSPTILTTAVEVLKTAATTTTGNSQAQDTISEGVGSTTTTASVTIITPQTDAEDIFTKSKSNNHDNHKTFSLESNHSNNNNHNINRRSATTLITRNQYSSSDNFENSNSISIQKDYCTVSNESENICESATEIQENTPQSINNNHKTGNLFRNNNIPYDMDPNHPSQLVYMSTTVPQNIKGNDIAGRHTPTRNSLRHSRMIVVNKNFQGPKNQNPLGLKYPSLTRILLVHHIVFGTLLTCIGFWILLWAPNTRLQDNPYWSGITLTLAGILGLFLIKFKRLKRHRIRENCFVFLKYDSYLLTFVASILCFIALICASIHLHHLSLTTTKCTSTNILIANAACTCVFGVIEDSTDSAGGGDAISDNSSSNNLTHQSANSGEIDEFYYRDLSCNEVYGAWKFILTVSVLLNALGFCVTIFYIISVFWKKKTKHMYTSVRTNLI